MDNEQRDKIEYLATQGMGWHRETKDWLATWNPYTQWDACMELQGRMEQLGLEDRYMQTLLELTRVGHAFYTLQQWWPVINATPAQRSDAIYNVLKALEAKNG